MKASIKHIFLLLILGACNSQIDLKLGSSGSSSSSIISGLISPFSGLIADNSFSSKYFLSQANAVMCADPVYAKLFLIQTDGSVDDTSPISSQLVSSSATYSFNLAALGLSTNDLNVKYIVKAEGCNGNTYKRPVTSFDKNQNIDAKTTVVSEVINANSLVATKLNQVARKDVEQLINSVSGTTTSTAFASITSDATPIAQFTAIFGASSSVIQNAKPEVTLTQPSGAFNELAVNAFSINAFHVDPAYSFVYKWKLDGVLKSSAISWNFIPTANESGSHTVSVYVGKDDGGGNIDITKPYYVKSISVFVNNNILPVAPNVTINSGTPSPRTTNSINLDLNTGVAFANCASFSHMAITDTATVPGIMQFSIDCTSTGTQVQPVTFSTGDGSRILYLWSIDIEGNISTAKTVSLILDMNAPTVAVTDPAGPLKGGSSLTLNFSATDVNVISSLQLFYAADGVTYGGPTSLTVGSTSFGWTVPSSNVSTAKIKIVATDIAGNVGTAISNAFTVDSAAPTTPAISRSSAAFSNSTSVSISTTCIADYDKILYSQTATTPTVGDVSWEACAASKTFAVSTGDALKTIYAFTKDVVGNISSSSNVTMTLDTTLPTLSLTSFNSGGFFAGANSQNITWSASDTNSASTPITLSYSSDGSSYTSIATGIANSGSHSWTLPAINNATVTIRITATDLAGNIQTITSSNFSIDSIAPNISSFSLAGGLISVALPNVAISVSASDAGSGLNQMRLSETSTYANNSWQTYSSSSSAFDLSSVSGAKIVYLWAKDNVGNISSSASYNISLDFGNPPVVAVSSPVAGVNYIAGDVVPISWTCSGTNGLATNPVNISYTKDDGVSFISIANNVATISGNLESYNWTFPSGITAPVQIRVDCKSLAGVFANSLSAIFNTSGWSVYVGNTSYGLENVNASVADIQGNNVNTFADTYGNIYYQKNYSIMKIDRNTGLVTRFAGDPTPGASGCAMATGVTPTSVLMATPYMIGFDSSTMKGLLFGQACGAAVKVFRIDVDTNAVALWATLNSSADLTNIFYTPNGYLIYKGSASQIFTVKLTITSQSSIVIGTSAHQYILANADGSKIWLSSYNIGVGATDRWDGDITTGSAFVSTTITSSGLWAARTHCLIPPFDLLHVYCQNRDNWPLGRNVFVFDLATELWTTSGVVSYPNNDDSGNIAIGYSRDKLIIRYLEQMYTSIPVIGGTWTTTLIAGQASSTIGNGTNPLSAIAFEGVENINYVSSTQTLYIGKTANLRKIDLSGGTPVTSTLFGPIGVIASGYHLRMNYAGTKASAYYSCSYHYINSLNISASTVTNSSNFLGGGSGCASSTSSGTFPPADGSATFGGTSGSYFYQGSLGPGTIGVYTTLMHSNGKVYFFSKKLSDSTSPMIFSSDASIIKYIAGTSGASLSYNAGDSGGLAIGAKLGNVQAILEVKSGVYAGDLLLIDNDRLRRISIVTESATPKIYDVQNLTLIPGYVASTAFVDAYYDISSETGTFGTGNLYYVSGTSLHKWSSQGNVDTTYSFSGTTLSGVLRIARSPAGILITQPTKKRILRVSP